MAGTTPRREATATDVLVLWTRVPAEPDIANCLARLDGVERARAARFHFQADRDAYVVAHGLLRHALDRLAGPRDWRFAEQSGGKPVVAGIAETDPHFSLSHTRQAVAVAVGWHGPIGVDVEALTKGADRENVAAIAFAPEERARLDSLRGEGWLDAFFALWTLKEAAIKATGQGLSADLPAFAFGLEPPRLLTAGPDGSPAAIWRFLSERVAGCRLAAATRAGQADEPVFTVEEVLFPDL